jgi:hypothetical protein
MTFQTEKAVRPSGKISLFSSAKPQRVFAVLPEKC